ncbi:MAG: hypothetical protein ACOYL6_12080 [Bacteriovoracaceae bacterium]
MLKWIISLYFLVFSFASFANCEAYFDDLNQKILARSLDQSLTGTKAQSTFLRELKNANEIDRLLVMNRLISLAGKDLKLADDFTHLLQGAWKENIFSQEEIQSIIMANTSERLVFDFNIEEGIISYQLNVGKKYLKALEQGLKKLKLPDEQSESLRWLLLNQNFTNDKLRFSLKKIYESGIYKTDPELLESYLHYLRGKTPEVQQKLLEQMSGLNKSDSQIGPELKSFNQTMKKIKNYEERSLKEALKEADKRFPEKSLSERVEFAKTKAREKRRIYEHLNNGCKNKGPNPENKMAAKKFAKFKLLIVTTNSTAAYTYFNWDKDKNLEWFSKLGYELGVSMIMSWVNSKIITNPNATYLQKVLANYGTYSISDIFSSLAYSKLFGNSNKKLDEELEKLKKDPDFEKKIKELHAFLEEQKVDQNFIEHFNHNFTNVNLDPEKITPKDLDTPEMKEALLEVISDKMYEENAGKLLQTGSMAMDRYSFARLFSAYSVPKGIAISLWIYHILCMSSLNPQAAYLKATLIFMTDSMISNAIYYKLRRDGINQ